MCMQTKIERWIDENRDELIGFLQTLLRIPSVTGNEGAIQDFISDYCEGLGAAIDKWVPDYEGMKSHSAFVATELSYENRPNVVAVYKGTGGGRSLLFNGHVDVVPEGPEEKWLHSCWSGDLEDGRIYGRGASDMKSGVAAMTMAMRALKACGVQLRGDVITEYVMDEEATGNGTLACVLKGYKADGGICCETSSMCVQPGCIGRIWFEIRVTGKAAGIQKRFEGVNAIDLGYIAKQAVDAFEKVRLARITHPLYPDIVSSIPCMVGQFNSGFFASAFPDACIMKGSLATVPGENSQEVKDEFVAFITEYCEERNAWFKNNPPEVIWTGYFGEPSAIPVETPIVQTLIGEYRSVMREEPVISGRQGAADIRYLNNYGQTPTVIFGPGLTEQMHANNEWVYAEDYINAINILARTVISWCGTGD